MRTWHRGVHQCTTVHHHCANQIGLYCGVETDTPFEDSLLSFEGLAWLAEAAEHNLVLQIPPIDLPILEYTYTQRRFNPNNWTVGRCTSLRQILDSPFLSKLTADVVFTSLQMARPWRHDGRPHEEIHLWRLHLGQVNEVSTCIMSHLRPRKS